MAVCFPGDLACSDFTDRESWENFADRAILLSLAILHGRSFELGSILFAS